MAGRPKKQEISSDSVKRLMKELDCEDYNALERKTGISADTWRNWGLEKTNPMAALDLVDKMVQGTGKSVKDLKQIFKTA